MKKKELKIGISYEPNRLEKAYMGDAYELLRSLITRPINLPKQEKSEVKKIEQRTQCVQGG